VTVRPRQRFEVALTARELYQARQGLRLLFESHRANGWVEEAVLVADLVRLVERELEAIASGAGRPAGVELVEWVPVNAAAAALQVSERRVRQLIGAGLLRGRRVGHVWVVHPDDIEARRAA
jgi:hypothetical protein